ncbi:MAG: hypothetical protein D6753_10740 [Planctomycetota bacterium]|nr:MAG: hypothetical protein D6753_10740 [Planctomycetota bacterium]
MMHYLFDMLYELSTALLGPVVLCLFLLLIQMLLELGGAIREWNERRRVQKNWDLYQRGLATKEYDTPDGMDPEHVYPGFVLKFVQRAALRQDQFPLIEKCVDDIEIESSARLARLIFLVRIGPMLGLMGTLIPMGPALIHFSEANVDTAAQELVVAFGTTVLGLLVGGGAFTIWLARKHWYAQDLADIEYLRRQVLS